MCNAYKEFICRYYLFKMDKISEANYPVWMMLIAGNDIIIKLNHSKKRITVKRSVIYE